MKNLISLILLSGQILIYYTVVAQTDTSAVKRKVILTVNTSDKNTGIISADTSLSVFILQAAAASGKEITLGRLAQEHAITQSVKDFATQMIKDHTQIADELKQLAAAKRINIPISAGDFKDMLIGKKGIDFDREYMRLMIVDHQKSIGLFEGAAAMSADTDVKTFASKKLPVLRAHFDMARIISERINAGATTESD